MTLDIVAVAFGFETMPTSALLPPAMSSNTNNAKAGRDAQASQVAPPPPPPQGGQGIAPPPPPPPPYALHTAGSAAADLYATDSLPFISLKQSLHERCPQGSLAFNRHWCVQVEGATTAPSNHPSVEGGTTSNGCDASPLTLQATFRRVDFFIASWTASLGTLLDTPATRLAIDRAAAASQSVTPDPSSKRCWDTLRQELPPQILALRLWATSLPAVLKHTRMTGGGNAGLKGSFASVSSVTSPLVAPSSPKGSLLKFTQATLSIPIRELLAAPAAGTPCRVGDGADFATSRVLRIDILRSAINEMALLMLGGGAAPSEDAANDPSVTETASYHSSIGVVGLQVLWVPGSATSTPPLSGKTKSTSSVASDATTNGPSDEETSGLALLAKDLVLELQFLTQTSSNAGKKAIEAAVREFLPASFFEEPSSLLIGVANQQDGSVHNVTLRSPSLGSAATPHSGGSSRPTPPIKMHASWSAAVSGTPSGGAVRSNTPRSTHVGAGAPGPSLISPRSFPGLGPSVAAKAPPHAPSSNSSASSKGAADGRHSKPHSPSAASPTNAMPPSGPPPTVATTGGGKTKPPADNQQQGNAPECNSSPMSVAGCPGAMSSTSGSDCSIKRKSAAARKNTAAPQLHGAAPPVDKAKEREAPVGKEPAGAGENTAAATTNAAAKAAEKALTTLQEDVKRQAQILLMHSLDLAILDMQFEELLNGRDSSTTTPSSSTVLRASRNTSISSSGISSATNIPSILSTAPLISPQILDQCATAVRLALSAMRDLMVTPETRSLAKSDLESTVGPNSKMLKGALDSGCTARLDAYRSFQKRQKTFLMDAIGTFGLLFSAADVIVDGFEKQLRLLNLEEQEWQSAICDGWATIVSGRQPTATRDGADSAAPPATSMRRGQGKKGKKALVGVARDVVSVEAPPDEPAPPVAMPAAESVAAATSGVCNAASTRSPPSDGPVKAGVHGTSHSVSPNSQGRSGNSSSAINKPTKSTAATVASSHALPGVGASQRNSKLLAYGVMLAIAFAIAIVAAAWA